MPPNEWEARARLSLRQAWLKVFVTAFLLVAMAAVVGLTWTDRAHSALGVVTRDAAELQTELAKYSEGIAVRAQVKALEAMRAEAGSNDLRWRPLVAEIKAALPSGVRLVGLKLAPGAAPVAGADPRSSVGLKGTLAFSARTSSAQAETITRLRTLPGFLRVDAGQLSSDSAGAGFTFIATFSADQTRYTNRFAQKGAE